MSNQGYLIRHFPKEASHIFFCVLSEGKLKLYNRRNGSHIENLVLSGCKMKLHAIPNANARGCSHSFVIQTMKVIMEGGKRVYAPPISYTFSAPSREEKKAWGDAFNSWHRKYWRDPEPSTPQYQIEDIDQYFQNQFDLLQLILLKIGVPLEKTVVSAPNSSKRHNKKIPIATFSNTLTTPLRKIKSLFRN